VDSDWADCLSEVEPILVNIAKVIAEREIALISAFDGVHLQHIDELLAQAGADMKRVRIYIVESDDTWARDHGPITVIKDGQLRLLDFVFNGWGNKFAAQRDNEISNQLHDQGAFDAIPMLSLDFVLEGGSLETDGEGTLMTTTQCLLSQHRNPEFNQQQVETFLKKQFGLNRVVWLQHGHLEGDDTDAHIDTLARFANAHTIVYQKCNDPLDPHFDGLQKMESELAALTDVNGDAYKLIPLPWPAPVFDEGDGRRLPATCANFLIINGAVLLPTYNDEARDAEARRALTIAFPDREILPIDCSEIIKQNGSLHCLTMQLPKGVLPA
jgi:agmatine/peptidylarginine deiminase